MFKKIAFIGAGSMAEAFVSGIIKKEFVRSKNIYITNYQNKERLDFLKERYHIQASQNKEEVIRDAEVIVLSIKPYDIKLAIESIKPYLKPNQLIISVVAGISTDYIAMLIDHENPIIRAMPNTSASIGLSATALTKGITVTDKQLMVAEQLFKTIGITVIIDEKNMDTVTAISGSGPAYIYYVVEAMEDIAVELGLDPDVAKILITQTVIGAGEMLKSTEKNAGTLRKNITSPAGTTEAAIRTLESYHFKQAIKECVKSAYERSVEMGKSS